MMFVANAALHAPARRAECALRGSALMLYCCAKPARARRDTAEAFIRMPADRANARYEGVSDGVRSNLNYDYAAARAND